MPLNLTRIESQHVQRIYEAGFKIPGTTQEERGTIKEVLGSVENSVVKSDPKNCLVGEQNRTIGWTETYIFFGDPEVLEGGTKLKNLYFELKMPFSIFFTQYLVMHSTFAYKVARIMIKRDVWILKIHKCKWEKEYWNIVFCTLFRAAKSMPRICSISWQPPRSLWLRAPSILCWPAWKTRASWNING